MRPAVVFATLVIGAASVGALAAPQRLPEFPPATAPDWIQGGDQLPAGLRGHPVLVEFWTFACSNCLATLPWMRDVNARFASRGLRIVSIHTPELPYERDPVAVGAAVRRLGIGYPVLFDPDFAQWNAFDNRYWPAVYLFNGSGQLLAAYAGEIHVGDLRARELDVLISRSLAP